MRIVEGAGVVSEPHAESIQGRVSTVSVGIRVFVVSDDNSIRKIPANHFERLISRKPDVRFPEYAGKRIRFAVCMVELENRRPSLLLRADYMVLTFDEKGMLDEEDWYRGMRLALDSVDWSLVFPKKGPSNLIDARNIFSRERYLREYTWHPDNRVKNAILSAIFRS